MVSGPKGISGAEDGRRGAGGRRRLSFLVTGLVGAVTLLVTAGPATGTTVSPAGARAGGRYIVQSSNESRAARLVTAAGGRVTAALPIVGGVAAQLDGAAVAALSGDRSVSLTRDVAMRPFAESYGDPDLPAQLDRMDPGQLWSAQGGAGVGVALIDTGVADVAGIDAARIVRSPDFSGSGDVYDGYGHGTFMAGLIAGNSGGNGAVPGVAPAATLVSVKVADSNGDTTLSEVIQGIEWAVANRSSYDIKVMSLSFGVDISLPPATDPLDQAVEAAWDAGITVVTAAGNGGAGQVPAPGDDPLVITVGAETDTGEASSPVWSGYSNDKPDILAPGVSVVSLRDPGSVIDTENPTARVGSAYFVGSGTSMSTALVAGAAAVLIADHGGATPRQVKAALESTEGAALSGPGGPVDMAAADGASAWSKAHPPTRGQVTDGAAGIGDGSSAVSWDSVRWDSVRWDSVRWDSVRWDSVRWDSQGWGS
jgi:serine protease AprX